MKSHSWITALLSIILSAFHTPGAFGAYSFSPSSPLAAGKWVRIEVSESGIYEIGHSELRSLGFVNPEKVSVYGRGGGQCPEKPTVGPGNTVEDDMRQVPVWHTNGKLYFYGRGVRHPQAGENGFTDDRLNIYTDRGHYFITDGTGTLPVESAGDLAALQADAVDMSVGYDYRVHEQDLMQGPNNSGNEFWNCVMKANEDITWDFPVSYMASQGDCPASVRLALLGAANAQYEMTLRANNASAAISGKKTNYSAETGVMETAAVSCAPPADSALRMSLTLTSANTTVYYDRCMVNYPKDMALAGTELTQERLCVPAGEGNSFISVPTGCVAWDVTDPSLPLTLPVDKDRAYFHNSGSPRSLIVFNPAKKMLAATGFLDVPNQNLHSEQGKPYELLIVTVPSYRSYAEQIAGLHRRYDGAEVLVATTEEIYNEFSSGNPDPAAIRMMAKMMYDSNGHKLKNILLIGRIYSDMRDVLRFNKPEEAIIGVQEGGVYKRQPALAMDYYGVMSDECRLTSLSTSKVHVGVGLLPFANESEAARSVAKIEDYLKSLDSGDMAWLVNETMGLSCSGDEHLHDSQSLLFRNAVQTAAKVTGAGKIRHHVVMPDFYNERRQAEKVFKKHAEEGKLISMYIGHAGGAGLGDYLTTGSFTSLSNKTPTFMIFSGCDLAFPDYGASGLGIDVVLGTPRAFAGAMISTREAWASANSDLANTLANRLFCSTKDYPRSTSATIGECYAAAKSSIAGFNKLSYIYIGDPALTVPVPLRGIECAATGNLKTYMPGDVLAVSGSVECAEGDGQYNGKVALKLCEPTQKRSQIPYPGYIVEFPSEMICSVMADVKDGRFKAFVPIPESCRRFLSHPDKTSKLNLYVSAYSPEQRLSAGGFMEVPMAREDEEREEKPSEEERDVTPPVTEVSYDAGRRSVSLTVSDNTGLLPGLGAGVSLLVDDTEITAGNPECAVPVYSTRHYVGNLRPGVHTVRCSAIDLAGNRSEEKTFTFTLEDTPRLALLSVDKAYGTDTVTFTINLGELTEATLVVMDSEGREARAEQVTGESHTLDCAGLDAGVYRAALRSNDSRKICSDWVTFSVID